MTKCSLCNNTVDELFLGKLKGTILKKTGSSKEYAICWQCQKRFPTKEQLIAELGWESK